MAPAGALFSSARDMAQFLRLQLGNGAYRGKRLISERSMTELRTVVTPGGGGDDADGRTTFGYGLGWFIGTYRGHRAIWHGGGVDGMLSDMQLLPDDQVGVVVLTNRSPADMHAALTYHIFDLVLGLSVRDWDREAMARDQRRREAEAARWRAIEAQRVNVPPPYPMDRYAGTYRDSLLGDIVIAVDGERLVARYHPGYEATLEPWQYNTFRLDWKNPSALNPPFATFHQNPLGGPLELEVSGVGRFRR
jgi:hypothetical protein